MKKNTVLLVEENLWDAGLVEEALAEIGETQHLRVSSREYQMVHVQTICDALDVLTEIPIDVVLLDLNLPDSKALHSFFRVHTHAPGIPLVVLCNREDEPLAVSAVREGAEDYLIKDEIDCVPLARSLNYAIERHQSKTLRRPAAPTDDLTGVYSAEAFALLASHSLRLAARLQLPMLVAVAEVVPGGETTDAFARQSQDMALLNAADVFRAKFDPGVVIARIAPLRFAVIALFSNYGQAEVMGEHLSSAVDQHNQNPARKLNSVLRFGVTIVQPDVLADDDAAIEPLLALAAHAMSGKTHMALATAQ